MNLFDPALVRPLAIGELTILIFCGVYLQQGYRQALPPVLYWTGWGYGVVFLANALAIAVNAVSGTPVSNGARLFAWGILPSTLIALAACLWAMRRGVRHRREL